MKRMAKCVLSPFHFLICLPNKVEDDEEEEEAAKDILPKGLLHHLLRADLQSE